MRLLWLSNAPWTPFGYGVQTALFGKRLTAAGHNIAVLATYGHEGEALNWNGLTVFGKSWHPYGMDIAYSHARTFNADAILTLLDLQVMDVPAFRDAKWLAWLPVDHHNIPPVILQMARQAHTPIVMSQHASGELDKAGLPHEYVPCGVDTEVFKPLDRAESRNAMQFPADKFIIGMVAMNKGAPSRKAFQKNIAAFAALQKKYGDCLLYLHTGDGRRGLEVEDLVSYCEAIGLKVGYAFQENQGADVIFADQYGLTMGYTPDMMAKLYNSFDVLTAVTKGEGFGIPIVESQACGTPVIVGDWTSMPELCFSGWKVGREEAEPEFTPLGAFQYVPRIAAIAERMESAYRMRGNPDYRARARKGALQYDADKITEKYWLPTLERINGRLNSFSDTGLAQNLDLLRVNA